MFNKIIINILVIFTSCLCLSTQAAPFNIEATNTTEFGDDAGMPFETHNAQCTITSGDIRASAQATISRKLEGVCGTVEMQSAFQILETRLLQELYNLRLMIQNPNYQPPLLPHYNYKTYIPAPTTTTPTPTTTPTSITTTPTITTTQKTETKSELPIKPLPDSFNDDDVFRPDEDDEEDYEDDHQDNDNNMLKSLHLPKKLQTTSETPVSSTVLSVKRTTAILSSKMSTAATRPKTLNTILNFKPIDKPFRNKFLSMGLRDFEIYKFNNTIIKNGETKIFTYFWRIESLKTKLKSNVGTLTSPIFSISGLSLRVKATLNHLKRDYIYLQLEQMPTNDSSTPNVVLESGNLFKDMETKKFFRHKIVILNQGTPLSDLNSQELWNTNSGFQIPNSAILSNSYSKDDSILIKIIIYV